MTPADGVDGPGPIVTRHAVDTTGRTIRAVEKDMILHRLLQCRGNRVLTAATLGISVRTLRNKLNDYRQEGARIPGRAVA